MTDLWRPLPIPMLPANDPPVITPEIKAAYERAEREALEMMERAVAMMAEPKS